jgi:DNA-binding LytR/AlgR family response regulator
VRIHRNALVSRYHLKSLFTDRADVARVEIEGIELQPEVSRRNHTLVKKLLSGAL